MPPASAEEKALSAATPFSRRSLPIQDDRIQCLHPRHRFNRQRNCANVDGKTPKQAARSAKGRIAAANWLKGFEHNTARLPADDPMRDYDFGWMWKKLGISGLRS